MNEIAPYSSTGLVPHNMDEALRLAEFMARARTVPKHLQDSPGDCLMAIEQAMRWGMSPFAVAQATSVISGKLMYEGKLVAAAVETSGAIVGQIDYVFTGEGEGRSITVSATRRGETSPRTITVTLKDARTNNEMWKRQPDQQLCYHGVRVWARRWTPAVILGVYSREEMGPVIEGEVVAAEAASPERQAINDAVSMKAAAADMPRTERLVDKAKVYEPPPRSTPAVPRTLDQWNGWMDEFEPRLASLLDRRELNGMTKEPAISDAIAKAPPRVRKDIDALLAHAYERLPEPDLSDEALGDVEIEGAEKVAAG